MKLGIWEYNNYYSMLSNSMSYNLCIYQTEVEVDKETIDFFKYILQSERHKLMTDKDVVDDIIENFSAPVCTIKLSIADETKKDQVPIPTEIYLRTKSLFCSSSIPDLSESIKCNEDETIFSAIFKSNLKLKQLGFELDLLCGLDRDYKI